MGYKAAGNTLKEPCAVRYGLACTASANALRTCARARTRTLFSSVPRRFFNPKVASLRSPLLAHLFLFPMSAQETCTSTRHLRKYSQFHPNMRQKEEQ